MINLSQIFSWFAVGKTPSAEQFKQTWQSFWHKSEKLPQSQVFGLSDSLSSKANQSTVDNLAVGLIFRDPVGTIADLATAYPDAQTGWAATVSEDGYIYQYNDAGWKNTGLRIFPSEVADTWHREW